VRTGRRINVDWNREKIGGFPQAVRRMRHKKPVNTGVVTTTHVAAAILHPNDTPHKRKRG
jgi:hypothetical protein